MDKLVLGKYILLNGRVTKTNGTPNTFLNATLPKGVKMKEKKEVSERDIELLERHINSTKIQLIDLKNQFNSSLGKVHGSLILISLLLIIGLLIGYLLR